MLTLKPTPSGKDTANRRRAYPDTRHQKPVKTRAWNGHRPIRLIGVRLKQPCTGSYQINLFEDNEERIRLYQAMDNINFKFGDKTICRAAGMEVGTRNFNPFMTTGGSF
jgi:DNA polymerase-4